MQINSASELLKTTTLHLLSRIVSCLLLSLLCCCCFFSNSESVFTHIISGQQNEMTTSRMCWSWPTAVLARVLWTLLLFAPATLMVHAAVLHPSGGFQPSLGLGLDYGRLDGPVPALTADYNAGKEGCALVLTRSSLYDHTQSIFLGAG